jgi:hypothetical protein
MFEMLTGRRPFDTDPPVAAQQSPALRLRSAGVPAALAAVVAWALETQPDERPSTAAALLVALDAASSQQAASTGVAEPTLLMPAATGSVLDGPAATEVLPSAAANAPTTERSSGRTAILLFAGLLVVLGGAVAAATLGSDDVVDRAVVATALTSPQSVPADTAPLVTAPAVIETTVPAATVIPARVVEVVPGPAVVPLVPGFPATDDLEVFLFQIESDPDLLGQSGAELADELRKVIELRGVEQRKAAEKLQEVLAKWVADGEIPSAVGVALDELLAQLAKKD